MVFDAPVRHSTIYSLHSVNNGGEFFAFFSLFFPWKRAIFLSPHHSLLRLLSDGRIPPLFWAFFFAIPRSTPAMMVSFSPFYLSFLSFFPWKRALLLSPPHFLL